MMAVKKYKSDDIIRVVVYLLVRATHEHAFIMQKFMVKDHFPELKGKFDTDKIDDSMMQICFSLIDTDQTFALLYESSSMIYSRIDSIVNLYAIDIDELYDNERMLEIGQDFRDAIILNWFPYDGEARVLSDRDYLMYLHMFSLSMARLTHYLIKLVESEELDLDDIADEDPFKFLTFYLNEEEELKREVIGEHHIVIRALQALYRDQRDVFNRITERCYQK